MKITEHEMRGIILGKAWPADAKVNEGIPAYLVRKFDELHAKLDAAKSLAGIASDLNVVAKEGFAEVVAERDALKEQLSRYSMSPGWADQRRNESKYVRTALGFGADADDVSPKDLVDTITALQEQVQKLAAEGVLMRQIIDSVTNLDNEPQYHEEGMGCGLEDRNITDRYEAMGYGWDSAMERVYGEVIPCAEELDFSATDAVIREIGAKAVEGFMDSDSCGQEAHAQAYAYAAKLRAGEQP